MRKQLLIYLTIFALAYVLALIVSLLTRPPLFSNLLGVLAMLTYIGSLLPSMFRVVLPSLKKNQFLTMLLKHRRFLGVAAFMFALNHGSLLIIQRNLNLLDPVVYVHYFQGFSMMAIMTILAFTSSDESVKSLKKNWKKIHQLTYLMIFILPWHIIDKMSGHWTFATPISILLSTVLLALFLARRHKENVKSAA